MTAAAGARDLLRSARRVVVKAGTRTLLDGSQRLDLNNVRRILEELVALRTEGRQVIFVTSGAIGAGLAPLGHAVRPTSIPALQACAAVGQSLLMQTYNGFLQPHGHVVAQLLLTHEDVRDRARYLSVRHLLAELAERAVLPVINENDSVTSDEIRFGDNDVLAALVANAVDADLTILLSDVDAFYVGGAPLAEVASVTPEHEEAAQGPSALGSGGMASKLRAARMVTDAGGALLLAHGRRHRLPSLLAGEPLGTLFLPSGSRLDHRKRWIAHTLAQQGAVTVDEGGAEAILRRGSSLLPVGIVACEGQFGVGDAIAVQAGDGRRIAKGLASYAASDVRRIMGRRSDAIAEILGYRSGDEVIHRDDMVLTP